MTCQLFFDWLMRFSAYISKTPGRGVILMIDYAFCHGQEASLPSLGNVRVVFLRKSTTSRLHPLYAGVFAGIKRHFRRRQLERAVDFMEQRMNIGHYSMDVLLEITVIYNVRDRLDSIMIINYWESAGILS